MREESGMHIGKPREKDQGTMKQAIDNMLYNVILVNARLENYDKAYEVKTWKLLKMFHI